MSSPRAVKDETEIQNMSQPEQASQGQLVPGGVVDEEKAAKPKEKDISGSETAVEAKAGQQKGGKKMCMIAVALFVVIAIAAVVVVLLFLVDFGGPLRSKHYDVQFTMAKDIVLQPKKDGDNSNHKYTLIWLHGLDSNSHEAARMFANQPEEMGRITPDSMKIVVPQSLHMFKKDGKKDDDDDDDDKEEKDVTPPPEGANKPDDDKKDDAQDKKDDDDKKDKKIDIIMTAWAGSYSLEDVKKDAPTGTDKTTTAYWESMYDQVKLSAQADNVIQIIQTEAAALNNDYSKVLIGGINEGAVIALASYLKYADDSNPIGGVVSIGGIQGLTDYVKSVAKEKEKGSKKNKAPWTTTEMRRKVPLFAYFGAEDKNLDGAKLTLKTAFEDGVYQFAKDQYETDFTDPFEDVKGGKIPKPGYEKLAAWLKKRTTPPAE